MPKLDQCKNCKYYQENLNLCKKRWIEVEFNDSICEISKSDSSMSETTAISSDSKRRILKRGSVTNIHEEKSVFPHNVPSEPEDNQTYTINVSDTTFKLSIVAIALFVIVGICGIGYYFYDKYNSEEQELAIGQINLILDDIKEDKTLGCIKLLDHDFDGDTISLNYWVGLNLEGPYAVFKDSLDLEFFYLASLHTNKWEKIRELSENKETEIKVNFASNNYNSTVHTTLEEVCSKFEDESFIKRAMYVFAEHKLVDIKEYTQRHFQNSKLLSFSGVRLDKDFVRLALAFDDSQLRIGQTMLDSTKIDPNFTDKVGERGSILKELFSICTRTHRGFTIEYLGTHNNTHHILSWNHQRAMEFAELFKFGTNSEQKENQVGVTIVKDREN